MLGESPSAGTSLIVITSVVSEPSSSKDTTSNVTLKPTRTGSGSVGSGSVGSGVGVDVAVGSGVGVGVDVAVGTGVAVGFGVGVAVTTGLGVAVGFLVGVGVFVTLGFGVAVAELSRSEFPESSFKDVSGASVVSAVVSVPCSAAFGVGVAAAALSSEGSEVPAALSALALALIILSTRTSIVFLLHPLLSHTLSKSLLLSAALPAVTWQPWWA